MRTSLKILGFLICLFILNNISTSPDFVVRTSNLKRLEDSESLMSLSKKISFSKIDLVDLELIEGVGYVLANRIMEHKAKILLISKEKESLQFELVKGIGAVKSRYLKSKIKGNK